MVGPGLVAALVALVASVVFLVYAISKSKDGNGSTPPTPSSSDGHGVQPNSTGNNTDSKSTSSFKSGTLIFDKLPVYDVNQSHDTFYLSIDSSNNIILDDQPIRWAYDPDSQFLFPPDQTNNKDIDFATTAPWWTASFGNYSTTDATTGAMGVLSLASPSSNAVINYATVTYCSDGSKTRSASSTCPTGTTANGQLAWFTVPTSMSTGKNGIMAAVYATGSRVYILDEQVAYSVGPLYKPLLIDAANLNPTIAS